MGRDLAILGHSFKRAYRLPRDEGFRDLLVRIDAADGGIVDVLRPVRRAGASEPGDPHP